jgi:hypothetical protein
LIQVITMQAEARVLPLCPRFATAVFGRVVPISKQFDKAQVCKYCFRKRHLIFSDIKPQKLE